MRYQRANAHEKPGTCPVFLFVRQQILPLSEAELLSWAPCRTVEDNAGCVKTKRTLHAGERTASSPTSDFPALAAFAR
jgi:hypothetical protein